MFSAAREGIIISRFGIHADVEDNLGIVYRCNIRRNISSLITGDYVIWRAATNKSNKGIIDSVLERKNVLERTNTYGSIKPIAANINQIVIVFSILPKLSLNIIDRYLIASEILGIKALLVLNKTDLITDKIFKLIDIQMDIYRHIGYQVLKVSSYSQDGLLELKNVLAGHVNIFTGQSGVGKSSLLKILLDRSINDNKILINDLSKISNLGKHTTTTARLYHFPYGGDVIDSPGIREFSLGNINLKQITWAFIEFRKFLRYCKFRDCSHKDDLGCAIRTAVKNKNINISRFNNYHKIIKDKSIDR
ncbi:small ribosomal subunit biogenesis GTPase RsgA [Pantoea sp. Aalb]|uniref:small ribosomal subunit biogenesis GTPase RsgA n=1 Tax=Pantoea sp. Aalb TaxID=2576762 RepID=UPI001323A371|nr:small ribosomal subunit biogenesis GTPase RsgA [Pantoea sp. Aalb]MXP67670.1 small ribosomal subunit biogenesis GTPase RsgA [Pantoea sp. Aalb]